MEDSVKSYVKQFNEYADNTNESRPLNERDRDYVDHKQWTSNEAAILLGRDQAPVVMNRIAPKVQFLRGLESQRRTDPKAFPRTPQHQDDAEGITDALRFVADNTDFDQTASDCFDEFLVEGTEAAIVEVEKNPRGEYEIVIRQVPWDRFYYDTHARKKDFSDSSYMGITTWLNLDVAKRMFPGHDEDLAAVSNAAMSDDAHEDRPKWRDKKGERVRVNEHYFKKDGIWHLVFFTNGLELRPAKPSPYKDEYGEPCNPIEAASAYIDRDNNRYGAIRGLINPQDEINHRRSKALHMLSNLRVLTDPGVFKSATQALNQLRSGQAVIEKQTEGSVEILDNSEFAQGQLALLQEAKQEIDAQGANSALGGDDPRSQSGRALEARQSGGIVELAPIFDAHNSFKRRIYRQIWYRIKQFWDEEKWVRVTDDEKNLKFVGLNRPVTERDRLAEELQVQPEQVEQVLAQMGATVLPGALDGVVETRAQVSEIDVDIILAESPDTISIQAEQFSEIVSLAQVYGPDFVPFDAILELSSLRNKAEIIERLKGETPESQAQQQQLQQAAALEQESKMAKTQRDKAATAKDLAATEQTQVETQLALRGLESIG